MGKRKPRPKNYKKAVYKETVQILSHPINIFRSEELDENQGEFFPADHEIYLLTEAPSAVSDADRTLHEILHAISTIALKEEDRLSEVQVNTLSLTLIDFMAKNPEFVKRLIAASGG